MCFYWYCYFFGWSNEIIFTSIRCKYRIIICFLNVLNKYSSYLWKSILEVPLVSIFFCFKYRSEFMLWLLFKWDDKPQICCRNICFPALWKRGRRSRNSTSATTRWGPSVWRAWWTSCPLLPATSWRWVLLLSNFTN